MYSTRTRSGEFANGEGRVNARQSSSTVEVDEGSVLALPSADRVQGARWVSSEGLGHWFPQGSDLRVELKTQQGNWNALDSACSLHAASRSWLPGCILVASSVLLRRRVRRGRANIVQRMPAEARLAVRS